MLAMARSNVSCTRSSARSTLPQSEMANARKLGTAASIASRTDGRIVISSIPCPGENPWPRRDDLDHAPCLAAHAWAPCRDRPRPSPRPRRAHPTDCETDRAPLDGSRRRTPAAGCHRAFAGLRGSAVLRLFVSRRGSALSPLAAVLPGIPTEPAFATPILAELPSVRSSQSYPAL